MDFRSFPVAFVRSSVSPSTRCPLRSKRRSPLSPSFRCGPKPQRSSSESSSPRPGADQGKSQPWCVSVCASVCVCVSVSREDLKLAVQSGDWKEVREFYLTTFNSFIEINAAFKVKHTLLSSLSLTHSLISIPSSSYFFLNCVLRMLKRGACCCVPQIHLCLLQVHLFRANPCFSDDGLLRCFSKTGANKRSSRLQRSFFKRTFQNQTGTTSCFLLHCDWLLLRVSQQR